MGKIWRGWCRINLVLRILFGLIIGALLGIFIPDSILPKVSGIKLLGDVFVGALKAIAPVLVFFLVASSLSKAHAGIGKRFRTVIMLYMSSTFLAAVIAVCGSFLFPVKMILSTGNTEQAAPSGLGEVFQNLLGKIVENPVSALANANYLGVLFWAVLIGLALKAYGAESTVKCISDIADALSQVVRWIIQLAPIGILGLVFAAVSENGMGIFSDYGKLLLLLVGCMLLVALVVDPVLAWIGLRQNPYPLVFKCLKESGVTAFFTRSSAANIPVNMDHCDRLGLEKDFYSVSIPLGATINMDGAAVTITVMTLAVCNTLGVNVSLPTALLLSLVATVGACGASGVAGGSLLLIPMACSLFGVGQDAAMQAVAVGFIIGIIQDSVETALNSSGDAMFTITAEYHDRMKAEGKFNVSEFIKGK